MRERDLNQPGHLEAFSTLSEEGALRFHQEVPKLSPHGVMVPGSVNSRLRCLLT